MNKCVDIMPYELHTLLDRMKLKWTSTAGVADADHISDVICIGYTGKSSFPVILWIASGETYRDAGGEGRPKSEQGAPVHLGRVGLKEREAMKKVKAFYLDISTHWATPESRILGHVTLSPPSNVGVNSKCYTEDWAIIEMDPSKIDSSNFKGNAIDIGTCIPAEKLALMMDQNAQPFIYLTNRLLKLNGIIPDE
ncbi:hypothetical protein EDC04DRAFT_2612486 [Pisolithus marmoratus]|nr:hypothetical protein EDC04DRAFT_2612486 [Pisolithus marmoratus]